MSDPRTLPLRDIHLPPAPSWWPPAPGWWALLAVLIVAGTLYFAWRRRTRGSAIDAARTELRTLRARAASDNAAALLAEVSVLLRRLAVSRFPRREIAGVTGEAWLAFLDRPLPGRPFSTGPGRVLINGPYRRALHGEDLAPLFDICDQWFDALARSARRRRR